MTPAALQPLSAETRASMLQRMGTREYDLLIIGGGVNGVWAALDARLRGLSVALVEADDFGHGPSRNNSELLHGGFRYLKEWYQSPRNWLKFESVLHLVRDALRERETLMKIAPHLARPVPFCMPLYAPRGLHLAKKAFYGFGFWMYDLLSAAQTIQPFNLLSRREAIARLDGIREDNLAGAGVYYDCKMEPGRFIAEIVKAGAAHGVDLANYVRAQTPLWDERRERIVGFECEEVFSKTIYKIRAREILDATGPWGDVVRKHIWPDAKPQLRLSKGVHVMVKQLFKTPTAVAFFTDDDRIIFIIPWGEEYNYSLIGTTDTDFPRHPDEVAPDQGSIDYLISKVRRLFPHADLTAYGNYAGLRPLIRQESGSASSVSREHTIQTHGKTHVTSVFGGKWTTARVVAGEVVDHIFPEKRGSSTTKELRFGGENTAALIQKGLPHPDAALLAEGERLHIGEASVRHLVFSYGRNAEAVMQLVEKDPALRQEILPGMPFLHAEVVFAVRFEMAMRVVDFLIRRSIFGRLRQRGLDAAPVVARIMGKELGWSDERQKQEADYFETSTRIVKS